MASALPEDEGAIVPTSPTFPHELVSIAQQKAYRVAAANARQLRRRKVLSKRGLLRDSPPTELGTTATCRKVVSDITSPVMNTPSMVMKHSWSMLDRMSVVVSPPGKRQRYSSVRKIAPDVKGIQEICFRLQDQESVAIPTECTYERMQPFHLGSVPPLHSASSCPSHPHVYIPNLSMFETGSFWKQLFPKKSFALKQRSSTTFHSPAGVTVTRFNESMQVVRRLASHLWPGPVLLYVQVPQPIPGLTFTRSTHTGSFTDESKVQHYLALRSPCHPLSLKLCQEFYNTVSSRENDSCSSSCATASPSLCSTRPSPTLPPISRIASCESMSMSSSKTSSSSLSGLAPMEDSTGRSTTTSIVLPWLLVGRPMRRSEPVEDDEQGPDHYFRRADQLCLAAEGPNGITAVLDGEAHTEVLSVPTCGWQRPCPIALWIDADARVVRRRRTRTPPHSTGTCDLREDARVEHVISAARVAQALRAAEKKVMELPFLVGAPASSSRRSAEDRIQQAVLLKWKVVTEL